VVQLVSERMKLHSSVSRFSEGLHDYTELFMPQLTAESGGTKIFQAVWEEHIGMS